jgi:hypothetical protein
LMAGCINGTAPAILIAFMLYLLMQG